MVEQYWKQELKKYIEMQNVLVEIFVEGYKYSFTTDSNTLDLSSNFALSYNRYKTYSQENIQIERAHIIYEKIAAIKIYYLEKNQKMETSRIG